MIGSVSWYRSGRKTFLAMLNSLSIGDEDANTASTYFARIANIGHFLSFSLQNSGFVLIETHGDAIVINAVTLE